MQLVSVLQPRYTKITTLFMHEYITISEIKAPILTSILWTALDMHRID